MGDKDGKAADYQEGCILGICGQTRHLVLWSHCMSRGFMRKSIDLMEWIHAKGEHFTGHSCSRAIISLRGSAQ